jgi:hypothetical protein
MVRSEARTGGAVTVAAEASNGYVAFDSRTYIETP